MRHYLVFVMLSIFLMSFWGCASTQPTRFYLLSSLPNSQSHIKSEKMGSNLSLGIGPIEFPKYLNRPQIVTRASRHELALAEFHKWAEPLKDNFSHVLAENLSVLLLTDRIAIFPWKRWTSMDYQLVMDVLEFDGKKGKEAVLIARWSLLSGDGRTVVLAGRKIQLKAPTNGQDYASMVEALNQTLSDASQGIATAVKALPRKAGKN